MGFISLLEVGGGFTSGFASSVGVLWVVLEFRIGIERLGGLFSGVRGVRVSVPRGAGRSKFCWEVRLQIFY